MKPIDVTILEADFRTLFDWIQAGTPMAALSGKPYRWARDGFEATHMSTSPSGEYMVITGNRLVAYLRPKVQGYGHMCRIDLRAGTTAAMLSALAAARRPQPAATASPGASDALDKAHAALCDLSQDGATGGAYAMVRTNGVLFARQLVDFEAWAAKAPADLRRALLDERCELLVVDCGRVGGPAWKDVYSPIADTIWRVQEGEG